jgi:predicted permease
VEVELAAHIAQRREEYVAEGLDPEAAARAAEQKFGNRNHVAETCRAIDEEARTAEHRRRTIGDLRQDLGYAIRTLRRSPAFALTAILTLGLGMGATTTIFTMANWALLRPVPGVSDPANVSVFWVGRRMSEQSFSPWRLSYPNLTDVRARVRTMSLGAYQGGGPIPAAGGGQGARNVATEFVNASYFDVLGVPIQLGRAFTDEDDRPGSPFLGAIISDRLWYSMFQRDPDVLRQTLDVAGVRFAILGVAAPDFHGTERLSTTDLWLPGSATPIVRHMPTLRYDARSSGGYYELVARLKPGATWPQAQAELEALRGWLRDEYPTDNEQFNTVAFYLMGPIGPPPFARDAMTKIVGVTGGSASALLMLIACANVAGLLLIRNVGRRSEIAIRKALGASRGRLVRQEVAEGVRLWSLGGLAALGLVLLLRVFVDVPAILGIVGIDVSPPVDWRVLGFTGALSLGVGVAFSIAPALRSTRASTADTLRSNAPAVTSRMFVGTSLAVFQLAASLTLMVGAFLLVGTLRHLSQVPLGFKPDGLFVLTIRPGSVGYNEARAFDYMETFLQRLLSVDGVRSAATAHAAPFYGAPIGTRMRRVDADPASGPLQPRSMMLFTTGYFETLGIPLLRGRLFTAADVAEARRGNASVVVISDKLAHQLFADADPLGREVEFPVINQKGRRYQIVGVVGTIRYNSLVSEPPDVVYELAGPGDILRESAILIRTDGTTPVAQAVQRIGATLDPSLPLTGVRSMSEAIGRTRRDWDSLTRLLGVLAGAAALLTCVGLYGVVAHAVAQRRREFGIRAALGATRSDVWQLVIRRTAVMTGAGLAIGLVGAYAFAQVLSTRLVGVSPIEPLVWTLAALALVVVAALASIRPALSATRVNVSETLRAL